MAPVFEPGAFELLQALERENTTAWFAAHREEFCASLTEPMARLLETVGTSLSDSPWPLSGGRRTVMRQHRDTRFAATPYHTSVRGLLSVDGGPLAPGEAGAHVEVGRSGGFVGVGLYRPAASVLRPLRERMLEDPAAFDAIVAGVGEAGLELDDERVATMPRGFVAHAGHAVAGHLRRRSLVVTHTLDRRTWESGAALDEIVRVIRAASPLLAFIGHQRR